MKILNKIKHHKEFICSKYNSFNQNKSHLNRYCFKITKIIIVRISQKCGQNHQKQGQYQNYNKTNKNRKILK